jgi:hypothetical protein
MTTSALNMRASQGGLQVKTGPESVPVLSVPSLTNGDDDDASGARANAAGPSDDDPSELRSLASLDPAPIARQVPEHRRNISCATKTSRQRRTYLLVERMQEMVMAVFLASFMASFLAKSGGPRIFQLAIAGSVLLDASSALASQGPGVEGGTASPLTQLVMAILVYGASALIVGAGLIGALRRH